MLNKRYNFSLQCFFKDGNNRQLRIKTCLKRELCKEKLVGHKEIL